MPPKTSLLPRLFTALLLALLLALPVSAAGPTGGSPTEAGALVLSTSSREPRSLPDGRGYEDQIVQEAFRRIGVSVKIVYQPPERALVNADAGAIDGDCWRVSGLAARYPNLVMVPEPVDTAAITVFAKDPAMRITGWADLRPYNVAYINGWKILEARVRDARSVEKTKGLRPLFTLLDRNHADLVLMDPVMGQEVMRSMGLTGIRMLTPPLIRVDMHIYLHRRHAGLVPRLSEALRQMKHDGTFQRLTRAGLAEAGQ